MLLRVEVTQEDCRLGERGRPTRCPIARAMSRVLGARVHVGILQEMPDEVVSTWDAFGADEKRGGRLPFAAAAAALRYDCGAGMAPFAFELELPEVT